MKRFQFILLSTLLLLMATNIRLTSPQFALAKNDKEEVGSSQASENSHGQNDNAHNGNNDNNSQNSNTGDSNSNSNNNSSNGQSENNPSGDNSHGGNKPDSPPGQDISSNNNGGGNEDKITICHVPPGNPANAHAITISRNGWENGHEPHKAHADDFVVDGSHPCPPGGGGNPTPTSAPTPTPTPGGSSGSSGSSSGSSSSNGGGGGGVGGAGVSTAQETLLKQGEILGAETLAGTGFTSQYLSYALQALGLGLTLLWPIMYAATKKRQA